MGNANCLQVWSTVDGYHFWVSCLYQCVQINPHRQHTLISKGVAMFITCGGHFG